MARRVIALLGQPPVINEEEKAAEAIIPGHLVDYDGAGDLVKHATAGDPAGSTFALEREEVGRDIDTAYAVGDIVKVGAFHVGQRVYAFTPSGQVLAKGDLLESDGAGRLIALASGEVAIARMVEAVSAVVPGDTRIRVEVI